MGVGLHAKSLRLALFVTAHDTDPSSVAQGQNTRLEVGARIGFRRTNVEERIDDPMLLKLVAVGRHVSSNRNCLDTLRMRNP